MQIALFVTCPRGLETVLVQELTTQGCTHITASDGGVSCNALSWEQIYRINLYSRSAGRVLIQVAHSYYRNEQDIYNLANKTQWQQWFNVEQSFRVNAEGKRTHIKNINFIALKVKDGICDAFRKTTGTRPSVNKINPDIRIHVFLNERTVTLFVDSSGDALFKRGYRQETGLAPLRENLAAGLLLLAGYDGSQPLQDPFCGSGTIAIEAAWIAQNRAPGLMRHFGFEKLKGFNATLWHKLQKEAQSQICSHIRTTIVASDHDRALIRIAKETAQTAEVSQFINFNVSDALNMRPNSENGIMIFNPPYGVRLEEIPALHALYPQMGSWLKQHYAGWSIAIFSGDRDMPKLMRLSPKRKIPLYNGNLDCRLFLFDMVAGSNRQRTYNAPNI